MGGARVSAAKPKVPAERCRLNRGWQNFRIQEALDGIWVGISSDEDNRYVAEFSKPSSKLNTFTAPFEIDVHQVAETITPIPTALTSAGEVIKASINFFMKPSF